MECHKTQGYDYGNNKFRQHPPVPTPARPTDLLLGALNESKFTGGDLPFEPWYVTLGNRNQAVADGVQEL
jgi:hypothetical protein